MKFNSKECHLQVSTAYSDKQGHPLEEKTHCDKINFRMEKRSLLGMVREAKGLIARCVAKNHASVLPHDTKGDDT